MFNESSRDVDDINSARKPLLLSKTSELIIYIYIYNSNSGPSPLIDQPQSNQRTETCYQTKFLVLMSRFHKIK